MQEVQVPEAAKCRHNNTTVLGMVKLMTLSLSFASVLPPTGTHHYNATLK